MKRYRIEVTTLQACPITVTAESAQEALEAAKRHEGELGQPSPPEWRFSAPRPLEDN